MKHKLMISTEQNRLDSPVVKASIIFAIGYIFKEFVGFPIDDKFINACLIIAYAAWNVFSAWNNPKDKRKV